jgi:hypothetical protein
MMQKQVTMSVPSIKAKAGGRLENRMPSAEPLLLVLGIGHSERTIGAVPSAIIE